MCLVVLVKTGGSCYFINIRNVSFYMFYAILVKDPFQFSRANDKTCSILLNHFSQRTTQVQASGSP